MEYRTLSNTSTKSNRKRTFHCSGGKRFIWKILCVLRDAPKYQPENYRVAIQLIEVHVTTAATQFAQELYQRSKNALKHLPYAAPILHEYAPHGLLEISKPYGLLKNEHVSLALTSFISYLCAHYNDWLRNHPGKFSYQRSHDDARINIFAHDPNVITTKNIPIFTVHVQKHTISYRTPAQDWTHEDWAEVVGALAEEAIANYFEENFS